MPAAALALLLLVAFAGTALAQSLPTLTGRVVDNAGIIDAATETALTAHLVMPGPHPGDAFLREIASELKHHHRINHATIQIEQARSHCDAGC